MLTPAELTATANGFGVGYDQVRRDHLISHVLASLDALTRGTDHRPVFFGGTALARTWLPDGRLSEDIDLYVAHRTALVAALEDRRGLIWQLRREFPDAAWNPPPSAVSDPDPASLVTGSIQVRIQILRSEGGFDAYPTEERDLTLRYADAGSARLPVPTLSAFTAMKTAAWYDRQAPRDLWDLARLAELGALTAEAAELFRAHHGVGVAPWMFESPPPQAAWSAALGAQTAHPSNPEDCLQTVVRSWSQALHWSEPDVCDI